MSEENMRFEQIMYEIRDLAEEAFEILPDSLRDDAESHWYSSIITAINNNHDFLGGCSTTMEDSLENLEESQENDD